MVNGKLNSRITQTILLLVNYTNSPSILITVIKTFKKSLTFMKLFTLIDMKIGKSQWRFSEVPSISYIKIIFKSGWKYFVSSLNKNFSKCLKNCTMIQVLMKIEIKFDLFHSQKPDTYLEETMGLKMTTLALRIFVLDSWYYCWWSFWNIFIHEIT